MREKMRLNGSLTVEAAFVVPTVIFTYVFVIYMCFFLHDRAVIQNCLNTLSGYMMKGCLKNIDFKTDTVLYEKEWDNILLESWDDDFDVYQNHIKQSGKNWIEDKLFICSIGNLDISCSYQWLTHTLQCAVKTTGAIYFPIRIFNLSEIQFDVNVQTEITDAVKFKRTELYMT